MADVERPPCPLWAKIIATGGGVGYIPFAPGTFGSLAGLIIGLIFTWFYILPYSDLCYNIIEHRRVCVLESEFLVAAAIPTILFLLIGLITADVYSKRTGIKDPKEVVVDEIAGQLITLLGLSIFKHSMTNWLQFYIEIGAAFLLFRLLDIWKPWPIRWFEKLPGGWGIMMDDVVAGIFGAMILAALVHFHWLPGM